MAGSLRKVSLAEEEGVMGFWVGVFAGDGVGEGAAAGVGFGAGEGLGVGREAADSARVSEPGTASFLRMVSRETRSRCSQRRRARISRATSRARELRRWCSNSRSCSRRERRWDCSGSFPRERRVCFSSLPSSASASAGAIWRRRRLRKWRARSWAMRRGSRWRVRNS